MKLYLLLHGRKMDWETHVKEVSPGLLRYFSLHCNRTVANDLVQETLLRVVKHVYSGRFDSKLGTLRMYTYGVARFVRLEFFNSKSHREIPEAEIEVPQESNTQSRDSILTLRKLMSCLSEKEREVLSHIVTQDLSLSEIAQVTDVPLGTVKSHYSRAKTKMRNFSEQGGKP